MTPSGQNTAAAPVTARVPTLANRPGGGVADAWPGAVLAGSALACWPRLPLDGYEGVKLGVAAVLCGAALCCGAGARRRRAALACALALLMLLPVARTAMDTQAFWLGTPQRGQGGLALLLVLAIGACVPASAAARSALATAAVGATLALSLLALLQWLGLDPLRTGAERPVATLGSPLLLGQWLLLSLPVCAYVAARGPRRGLAWAALGLGLLALLASSARGAWLALLLAGVVAWTWRGAARRRRLTTLLLALVALLALATWAIAQRPASLGHRVLLWKGAWAALVDPPATLGPEAVVDPWRDWRLLWGHGADLEVLPLRQTAVASLDAHGADPDRAHQWLLDSVLRYGLWGLCALLLALAGWWRSLRREGSDDPGWQATVLFGLCAWWLSLQTAFALSADALLAALLAGSLGRAAPAVPARFGARVAGCGLLLAGFVCWLLPPGFAGSGWRRPEQALLAFEHARGQLRTAAAAPAGCVQVRAAFAQLGLASELDPWRPEYSHARVEVAAALEDRCGAAR